MEENNISKDSKKESTKAEIFDFLKMLLISIGAVLLITNFIARPIRVNGDSMYPTLKNDEIGLSNIIGLNLNGIHRFDIVIIYVPDNKEYLVKRVVGLPNETISYKDDHLYVNGEIVDEPFLDETYKNTVEMNGIFTSSFDEITLGEEEYFCLGDNRPFSRDSRYYGPFSKSQIRSKGALVLFPFNECKVVN